MTDLYLRDLSGVLRQEVERDIRKHRPELVDDMEFSGDIVVGTLLKAESYHIA